LPERGMSGSLETISRSAFAGISLRNKLGKEACRVSLRGSEISSTASGAELFTHERIDTLWIRLAT